MTDDNLPPLPEPHSTVDIWGHDVNLYTRSHMQAYARAAILAERERCAKVCEELGQKYGRMWKERADLIYGGMEDGANQCAAAIREGGK